MKNIPWHSKAVIALIAIIPVYFAIAALGTKIGLWGWQFGLGAMTIAGGPILLGATAVMSVISLVLVLMKKPRRNMLAGLAIIGLLIPGAVFTSFMSLRSVAEKNPIHDVATDTANPPQFSQSTIEAREKAGANPLNNYQVPLGELEMFANMPPRLAVRSHAQIITSTYSNLQPLPLGGASRQQGVAAVAAAMDQLGLKNIRTNAEEGIVEGVAETFWFGFKDDVVARVGEVQIDFRSVSRVGRSDLGANAQRIAELRAITAIRLGGN
ncbi:MAG: DUF1499 domain-containing protein [Erythrobacter sp.]